MNEPHGVSDRRYLLAFVGRTLALAAALLAVSGLVIFILVHA